MADDNSNSFDAIPAFNSEIRRLVPNEREWKALYVSVFKLKWRNLVVQCAAICAVAVIGLWALR